MSHSLDAVDAVLSQLRRCAVAAALYSTAQLVGTGVPDMDASADALVEPEHSPCCSRAGDAAAQVCAGDFFATGGTSTVRG